MLVWLLVGCIDIVVNVSGKVIFLVCVKIIVVVEVVSVCDILVCEGQYVWVGQIFMELDVISSDVECDKVVDVVVQVCFQVVCVVVMIWVVQ